MSAITLLISTLVLTLHSNTPSSSSQSDTGDLEKLRTRLIKSEVERLRLSLRVSRLEGKPEEEFQHLVDALKSEFSEVFGEALRELSLLPEDRRIAAVPSVLKRFGKEDDLYEIPAIEFLARVPAPEARTTVLESARSKAPGVRRAAAAALTSATHDEAAFRVLVALLEDADKEVRLTALVALGTSKQEAAVAPLVALLSRAGDEEIVKQAADALGAIGAPSAVDPLIRLLTDTKVKDVRWACIDSLGRIGERRAASNLRSYLGDAHPMDIRQVAIQALGKLKDADVLPALTKVLRTDATAFLRQEAASSIALMATPDAIESILLPAYLAEKDETVGQTVWRALLDLAGEEFPLNKRLAAALLEKGRRAEAELICSTRLHMLKPDEAGRAAYLELEEAIAQSAFKAGDARAALPHYRQLAAHTPERTEVLQQVAACYRAIKDYDSCLKSLRDIDGRLEARTEAWWQNRLLIVSALREAKNAEALVLESHALLRMNPPPHPDERTTALEEALRDGVARLAAPLADAGDPERARTLELIKKHGALLIGVLADLLENADGPRPALVHAGNAIASTTLDPDLETEAARKAAAVAWRAWQAGDEKTD